MALTTLQTENSIPLLLAHLRTLPLQLDERLVVAASSGGVALNGGDFSLQQLPAQDTFRYYNMRVEGYRGEKIILLSTPDVPFLYDVTGREVAHKMPAYGIVNRTILPRRWKVALGLDSADLRAHGLHSLAISQDAFAAQL